MTDTSSGEVAGRESWVVGCGSGVAGSGTETATTAGTPRPIIALPDFLARMQAGMLERLPGQLMSRDNLDSMRIASTCDCPFPEVFGIKPSALEAIAPGYLANLTPRGRYQSYRSRL